MAIPDLALQQVQKLLSLINTLKSDYETLSNKGIWMLDGDVSCHMSGELELFNDIENIMAVNVALPNDKEIILVKKDDV